MTLRNQAPLDIRISHDRHRTRRIHTALAIAVLVALHTVFYLPYLSGKAFFPYDFQGPLYGLLSRTAHLRAAGESTNWLPQFWGGMSNCAIPETGLYYPFYAPLFAGRSAFTLHAFVQFQLAHLLFGAIGAFVLARQLGARPLPALFSAVFFDECGYVGGHLQHSTIILQFSWLPWVFAALFASYRRNWLARTLLAGGLLGICGLVGSYVVYFGALAAAALVAFKLFQRALLNRGEWFRAAMRVGLLATGYVVVSAVVILPGLEARSLFTRGAFDEWFYRLDLRGIAQLAFPGLGYLGDPTLDQTMTVGVAALLLATFGIGRCRGPWTLPLAILAATFFLMGFHSSTFLGRMASRLLPAYSAIRGVMNAWAITQLALAPLIALGIVRLLRSPPAVAGRAWLRHSMGCGVVLSILVMLELWFGTEHAVQVMRPATFLALVVFIFMVGLGMLVARSETGAPQRRAGVVLMLLVMFTELGTLNSNIPGVNTDPRAFNSRMRVAEARDALALVNAKPLSRYDYFNPDLSGQPLWDYTAIFVEGPENAWGWSAGEMIPQGSYLLHALASDAADRFTPLFDHRRIRPGAYPGINDYGTAVKLRKNYGLPAFRLFGVRFVADQRAWKDLALPGSPEPIRTHQLGRATFYELPNPLPRAFLVPQAIWHDHEGRYLRAVAQPDWDPLQTIHLWRPSGTAPRVSDAESAAHRSATHPSRIDPRRGVDVIGHSADQLALAVTTDTRQWLFIANTYWPGWHAQIDGVESPVYRANFAFQAINVPAGTHEVRLRFDPASFRIGRALTLYGGSLLALACVILSWPQPFLRLLRAKSPRR